MRLLLLLLLSVACDSPGSLTSPRQAGRAIPARTLSADAPTFIDGRILVVGHDRQTGTYGPGGVIEVVGTDPNRVAIVKTWSNPGPDASLTAIAVDGSKGWSEIHAGSIGDAPALPLLFFVGRSPGAPSGEKLRIFPDGAVRLSPDQTAGRGACTEEKRGSLWFHRDAGGDVLYVCMLRDTGRYRWVPAAE